MKGWRASGLTAAEFCEGKGFKEGGLRYWASRLKRAQSGNRRGPDAAEMRLARVVRAPAAPPGVKAEETPIVIEWGGARVGVRRGFDAAALREVLSVLGGGR